MKNFLKPIFGAAEQLDDGNAYSALFGIPHSEESPNHYQLLGLAQFECNEEEIQRAIERRKQLLQENSKRLTPRTLDRISGEIQLAAKVLTDADSRSEYELQLRKSDANLFTSDAPAVQESESVKPAWIGAQLLEELAKENEELKTRSKEWIRMSVQFQKLVEDKDREIADLVQKLAKLTASAKHQSETIASQHEEIKQQLQAQQKLLSDKDVELDVLNGKEAELQQTLQDLRTQNELKNADLESQQVQVQELNARIAELKTENDSIPGLNSRIVELEQENQKQVELTSKLAEIEAENNRLGSLNKKVAELQAESGQIGVLNARVSELESKNEKLVGKLKTASPKLKEYKEEIKSLRARLKAASESGASLEESSQNKSTEIASLQNQIEKLTKKLEDSSRANEQQKNTLEKENTRLKRQISEFSRDKLKTVDTPLDGEPDPEIDVKRELDKFPLDSLEEFGGADPPNTPAPNPTQIKKPDISDSLAQFGQDKGAESRGTSSSLVALTNDDQDQGLDNSSLCSADDGVTAAYTVNFRVRERLSGDVVLDKTMSPGDCIRIGRLPDFCSFEFLAKRLATDRVLSGRHFQLDFGEEQVTIKDVGSTNGTLAAGELLKKQNKTIAYDSFVDHYVKIRAGELYHFELELIESNTASVPDIPPVEVEDVTVTDSSVHLPSPVNPRSTPDQDQDADDNSLEDLGFIADVDDGPTPLNQDNSNSRDSLDWEE